MADHESLAKLDREIEQLDGTIERLGERLPRNNNFSSTERLGHVFGWVLVLTLATLRFSETLDSTMSVVFLMATIGAGGVVGWFFSPYLVRMLFGHDEYLQDVTFQQRRAERRALLSQKREELRTRREELFKRLEPDMGGQLSISADTSAKGGLEVHSDSPE